MRSLFTVALMATFLFAFAVQAARAHRSHATQPMCVKTFDGNANWYGPHFNGRRTASGEVFDKHKLTAAHPSLPFGTRVRVKSLYTGKEVTITVNDRCPRLKQRCIDLSEGAARRLGIYPYAPSRVHCVVLNHGASLEPSIANALTHADH